MNKPNKNKSNTQPQQQQQQNRKVKISILSNTNKFLIISSIILILCLFLFNSHITTILSTTTPLFYSKYYYPIQSIISKVNPLQKRDIIIEKGEEIKLKAKESVSELKDKSKESVEGLKDKTSEKAEGLKDKSKERVEDLKDKSYETVEKLKDKSKESAENLKDKSYETVEGLKDKTSEKTQDLKDKSKESVEDLKGKFNEYKDKSKEGIQDIKDKSGEYKDKSKEAIKDTINSKELKENMKEKVEEKIEEIKMKLMQVYDYSKRVLTTGGSGSATESIEREVLTIDKLDDGKWNNFQFGSFVAEQGSLSKENGFIRVDSNPYTSTTELSVLDHLKYLAVSNQVYTIPEHGSLFVNFSARGQAFGNSKHPFPAELVEKDIESELRFANAALNVLDFKTSVVADFILTNSKVYALYEMLPFSRHVLGDYASFVYTIPVYEFPQATANDKIDNKPFTQFSVEYDKSKKVINWYVNDKLVFTVDRVGYMPPANDQSLIKRGGSLISSKGGKEMDIYPNDIQVCFGTLSLLDSTIQNSDIGLVRLDDPSTVKYYTPSNLEKEFKFYDDKSTLENRIFGQGFILDIEKISILTKE